ncbi:MAG: NAD-dependent epimerase/dehydratase family protein, partial [Lachnospiraceae bacterium]|nr:NAD-dependent epimerase/dehydratase family protein [Lachnospiraceae bacterium]
MDKNAKIYIAGHNGMAGSAIYKKFKESGYTNFVLRTSKELDLRCQEDTRLFFRQEKPDYV